MFALEKTRLTSETKIDWSWRLSCGDLKGLTWFGQSLYFPTSLTKTKTKTQPKKQKQTSKKEALLAGWTERFKTWQPWKHPAEKRPSVCCFHFSWRTSHFIKLLETTKTPNKRKKLQLMTRSWRYCNYHLKSFLTVVGLSKSVHITRIMNGP